MEDQVTFGYFMKILRIREGGGEGVSIARAMRKGKLWVEHRMWCKIIINIGGNIDVFLKYSPEGSIDIGLNALSLAF